MTVSELIEELRAMPADATVMLWNRMDDPQHRKVERIELSRRRNQTHTQKSLCSPNHFADSAELGMVGRAPSPWNHLHKASLTER